MSNMKYAFTTEEMENIFEIGRQIQVMIDTEEIEVEDSKEAYCFALQLAVDFEKEYPDSDDYYSDMYDFVVDKIAARFGKVE